MRLAPMIQEREAGRRGHHGPWVSNNRVAIEHGMAMECTDNVHSEMSEQTGTHRFLATAVIHILFAKPCKHEYLVLTRRIILSKMIV